MSMQALMAASQSMARMQTMQSARWQMVKKANFLRIVSKQDGGNQKKLDAEDALDEKSNNLMGDLMGEFTDVNETLKPDEEGPLFWPLLHIMLTVVQSQANQLNPLRNLRLLHNLQ